MNYSVLQLVKVIKADPAVAHVNAYTGGNGASNGGFIYIALKPLNERKVSADAGHQSPAAKAEPLPVASAFLQAAQDLRIGGRRATRCTNTPFSPTTSPTWRTGGPFCSPT